MLQEPLTDREFRRLARFRYALRRFLRFSEDAARRAGISAAQYQLMLFVRAFEGKIPPSISDLAERLQVSHHSTVELIDRCQAAGLISRIRDPGDARRARIRLTAVGSRLLTRLVREHYARLGDLRRSIPRSPELQVPLPRRPPSSPPNPRLRK